MLNKVLISVITPTYNEIENVDGCVNAVKAVMEKLPDRYEYEHIFIDNRSNDGTILKLQEIALNDSKVKVIVNSKNLGASKSVYRALGFTSGDVIIPMVAADLQDPPSVISLFVSEWEKGFKLVFGQRSNRRESLIMRMTRSMYYRIIRKMAEGDIPLNAGEFLLVDRQVLDTLLATNDKNPYVRGLFAQTGIEAAFVPYNWSVRTKGKSKATLINMVDLAVNGLVSTSRLPARLALLIGFLLASGGFFLGLITALSKLFGILNAAPGIPTLLTAVFILGGAQLFFLGLVGEYVLSIHSQVKPEPEAFSVLEINFSK